ncbi:MAG: histidinol dehydrogenase [Chitinophagaceae bacterium]|nr:histidinol dehydrogenase [Chitinophagaceae bacterium]
MIKVFTNPAIKSWSGIIKRPVTDTASFEKSVRKILKKVEKKGDQALHKYSKDFDRIKIKTFRAGKEEINGAAGQLTDELKTAILQAKENIFRFHKRQKEANKKMETMPGVTCWRRPVAIEKVGFYIPGGSAPLFSTVLMLAIPASIAGCKEIILCTPPAENGSIHPAILYTAQLCGIEKIYKVGGAQAISAMAYGTETIPKVQKIFGPGNQYVTTAKQLVQYQGIAIDMPAGPSEILVIADNSAVPAFVAADLVSQAEHGPDSQVILITISSSIAKEVKKEIKKQVNKLPRKKIALATLSNSKIIILKSIEEAIKLSNFYAPEHLILACEQAEEISKLVTAAGSVFLGNYSPESAGDYASGTNHTLPTNGYAAMYSGVSLDSFVKKITFQQLTKEGLQKISNTIITMASAEGLDAHKNAVSIRLIN